MRNKIIFKLALLVFFGLASTNLYAEAAVDEIVYTVRDQDTLWDIANRFLEDPSRWKEIWENNPDIENPDLVYPGDKLIFHKVEGKEKIRLTRATAGARQLANGVVKLSPKIRVSKANTAISTIPLNVIKPFLSEVKVIDQKAVQQLGRIVALDEDHLVVGEGNRIYVKGQMPFSERMMYLVLRPGEVLKHPKSKEVLGREAQLLGRARLEARGSVSSFILTQSFAEVGIGDLLYRSDSEEITANFFPKRPEGMAQGQIISVNGGLNQIGQYQVVVITGGQDLDRAQGDVLNVYQSQKDLPSRVKNRNERKIKQEYPSLKVGKLMVFKVFEKVSYALVLDATRPIYLLDQVGTS